MRRKTEKYIIICDESTKHGKLYSYFLGGAMILERDYQEINDELYRLKHLLVLKELKRNYIDITNADKYIKVLQLFFDYIKKGKVKVRVFFSDNKLLSKRIKEKGDLTFNKFYYFLLKFGFNIKSSPTNIDLRIMFDMLPDKESTNDKFKKHLVDKLNIPAKEQNDSFVSLKMEDISEVDSKKHMVLQCVDVIIGLMDYFCNDFISEHYITSKKEKGRYLVLNYILSNINTLTNNIEGTFDIFKTTPGLLGRNGWAMKYAHYMYKPTNLIRDIQKKREFNYRIKKDPLFPTLTN